MGRNGEQPPSEDERARSPEMGPAPITAVHHGTAAGNTAPEPAARVPALTMAPTLARTRPPARTGRRVAGLSIVGLLLWGGLMALYWVRAAHSQWTGLQWAGQILFTLLVAILLTAIIGSVWGIEDW